MIRGGVTAEMLPPARPAIPRTLERKPFWIADPAG